MAAEFHAWCEHWNDEASAELCIGYYDAEDCARGYAKDVHWKAADGDNWVIHVRDEEGTVHVFDVEVEMVPRYHAARRP